MGVRREPFPDSGVAYARQGDTADIICARYLGEWSGATEKLIDMGDTVIVKAVDVVSYTIDATIEVTEGPQIPLAQTAAEDALQDYVNARHAIGLRVTESGIHEALTVAGVDKVTLTGFNDIEPTGEQAAYCTGFTVNVVVQNV